MPVSMAASDSRSLSVDPLDLCVVVLLGDDFVAVVLSTASSAVAHLFLILLLTTLFE